MMPYMHLFSYRHRREGDLCRLEHLAAAARLGTAWLPGVTDRASRGKAAPVRARNDRGSGFCYCTLEHCHGRA